MKTSKQHAQEITRKIERQKARAQAQKKRTLKAFAFSLAVGLLLPATVYASASAGRKSPPVFDPSAPVSDTAGESEKESGDALPKKEQKIFSAF